MKTEKHFAVFIIVRENIFIDQTPHEVINKIYNVIVQNKPKKTKKIDLKLDRDVYM